MIELLYIVMAIYGTPLLLLSSVYYLIYRGRVKLLYKLMDIVEEIRKRIE